jgi:glycosyltransferase involved in cell wall biosynthesis
VNPLVSILIPAFNAEEWLAESLESAVRQTYPRKEIIVVNDGSRDHTLAVARRFASKEVTVATQDNQGAAATRNRALSICQGDYIQWLDADDLLAPDKIAIQMDLVSRALEPKVLLSSAWGMFMYRARKAHFVSTPLWQDLSPVEWLILKMGQNLHMQTATWLVSRSLTEAAGLWNTQLLTDDDGEYFCRVLVSSTGTRFSPDAKVFYRMPGSSNVSYIGQSTRKMEAQFLSMQMHVGYLRSLEDSERVREACVTYLQNWLPHFYPERLDIVERARQLAETLGGRLTIPPPMSWKYSWIQRRFGWSFARHAQIVARQCRWSLARFWNRTMFRLERRILAGY